MTAPVHLHLLSLSPVELTLQTEVHPPPLLLSQLKELERLFHSAFFTVIECISQSLLDAVSHSAASPSLASCSCSPHSGGRRKYQRAIPLLNIINMSPGVWWPSHTGQDDNRLLFGYFILMLCSTFTQWSCWREKQAVFSWRVLGYLIPGIRINAAHRLLKQDHFSGLSLKNTWQTHILSIKKSSKALCLPLSHERQCHSWSTWKEVCVFACLRVCVLACTSLPASSFKVNRPYPVT